MVNRYVKYFLCLLFCLFVCPLITHAACDYQRMAELSKIASNVQFSYSYEVVDGYPQFIANISNITSDIYLEDNYGNIINSNNEIQFSVTGSDLLKYNIYSKDNSCYGELLTTKYLSLPIYNYYSEDSLCQKNLNSKYCQKWGSFDITYDDFKYDLTKNANDNVINDNSNNFFDKVLNFVKNWENIILVGLIGLAGALFTAICLKRKRGGNL